jgi:hypothetical protein
LYGKPEKGYVWGIPGAQVESDRDVVVTVHFRMHGSDRHTYNAIRRIGEMLSVEMHKPVTPVAYGFTSDGITGTHNGTQSLENLLKQLKTMEPEDIASLSAFLQDIDEGE